LAEVVKTLKDLVAEMQAPPASPAPLSSSRDLQPVASVPVEMVTLAGGLMFPKRTFDRLSNQKCKCFHKSFQLYSLDMRLWPPQASLGIKQARTHWILQKSQHSLVCINKVESKSASERLLLMTKN
ncbi:hypothetical protein NFI96_021098, partial [Prochilodus magdalenae]